MCEVVGDCSHHLYHVVVIAASVLPIAVVHVRGTRASTAVGVVIYSYYTVAVVDCS